MSGYEIYNNTFKNCYVGTFIGGGRRNNVYNNQYYNCTTAVHEDNRGLTWQKSECSPVSVIRSYLFVASYIYAFIILYVPLQELPVATAGWFY